MSIILALHARYEAASTEHAAIEEAMSEKDYTGRSSLFDALHASSEQCDLLSVALLHQVPTTDEEVTVLAGHTWNLSDRLFENSKLRGVERRALRHGINSIFDYLVSEGRADMERMGPRFTSDAMLAFHRRCLRTGRIDTDREPVA